jgi:hypothetical protein
VGVFFVTQTPKDVPEDVLAQLGNRVQHQLRASHPQRRQGAQGDRRDLPEDRRLRPGRGLQQLGIGEAIVTVLNPSGAPTPVAWTRMRAPESSMDPLDAGAMAGGVATSSMQAKYGTRDRPRVRLRDPERQAAGGRGDRRRQ